ncbi:MAG: hypothetical protein J2P19_31040 [Pseudonocardia sp.]|nr:hypothetical protein [Pseudonocardia sp.]
MTTLFPEIPQLQAAGADAPCVGPLASYLVAVCRELATHQVSAREARVQVPGPQQPLCASLVLTRPGWPGPVPAGWHEEFGWWAGPRGGTDRRYLSGSLAPDAVVVAEFLALGAELGSTAPVPHRYRLLNGGRDLVALLDERSGDDRG